MEGYAREAASRSRSARTPDLEQHVRSIQAQAVKALARMAEKRDPYTHHHQVRVSRLSGAIGRSLGLSAAELEGLELGALVHDIGKIYVPMEILNRPGRLTGAEFELIKSHTEVGVDIVDDMDLPWPVREIIVQHHERLDGSGYPLGLAGGDICLEARIVAVADVVEAMASHRPYRPAVGLTPALETVAAQSGIAFDADVVSACLAVVRDSSLGLEQPD